MKKPHIVIVGGGFGGVYTALNLKSLIRAGEAEVTLINRTNYFLFTPLLHEVATGGLTPTSVAEPLRQIFKGTGVSVMQTSAYQIDTDAHTVRTEAGDVAFDYAVISTGATTNFYNVPGAQEHSFTLKNLADALEIRSHLIDMCERAAMTKDTTERARLMTFVVVGAGATGIEVATEMIEFVRGTLCSYYREAQLKSFVRVIVISSSNDVVPQFNPVLRAKVKDIVVKKGIELILSRSVTKVTAQEVLLNNGMRIATESVFWFGGVKPDNSALSGIPVHPSGRVLVDEYLRVQGHNTIFALGDTAAALDADTHPAPMLAQIATAQATLVAQNICATVRGKVLQPYKVYVKGILISLGRWSAAGTIFGVTFTGRFMWWLWRTIYLFKFISWRKRFEIATEWTVALFTPRDITKTQ